MRQDAPPGIAPASKRAAADNLDQGLLKRMRRMTYAASFWMLLEKLPGMAPELVARCLQESLSEEEAADLVMMVPNSRITARMQQLLPGRIIAMPDDRNEFFCHGAFLCKQHGLTPYNADAMRLLKICETYQAVIPFAALNLLDSPRATNTRCQEQASFFPSLPETSSAPLRPASPSSPPPPPPSLFTVNPPTPAGLATHSLSFGPPRSPAASVERNTAFSSAQEKSRAVLENLDANTPGTTGGQPGDKVQDGKKAGRDKPRRDEEGLRQVHDVIKGDSNFTGVDKKGGFESNALPWAGTDAVSLSDEEDDMEAEAQRAGGPRYSIMMNVENGVDNASLQGMSSPVRTNPTAAPSCDTPPIPCHPSSGRGPAPHKKPPLAPEREDYWETSAPDWWDHVPQKPGGVLRVELKEQWARKRQAIKGKP